MTPPFSLTDVQLFEERAGRPELLLDGSLELFRLVAERSAYASRDSGSPDEGDEFVDGPDMVGESRLHCRRHAERLMHPAEVLVPEV